MEVKLTYKPEDFPNAFNVNGKSFIPSYEELCEQINSHPKLVFFKDVDEEEGLPPFVPNFYKYLVNNGRIPTQEEFYQYYVSRHKKKVADKDIKGRAYRAYPSIIRDIHFAAMLRHMNEEQNFADEVKYSSVLDMQYDADVMVTKGDKHVGICLFTNDRKSYDNRKKKQVKRFENVEYIELPISIDYSNPGFTLYTEEDANKVITKVNELLNNV